jgi:asparagine synthase (glutamine-hydrolysing)
MCGIAGLARTVPGGIERRTLERMADSLSHRGPDASGVYASERVGLAHTRLSIIDLAGGAQPLANEDGQVVVTFNGEVFNYIELRAELVAAGHVFHTKSDTEVLVHGYEQWGDDFANRLIGQFAFAIHDRRRERVLLVRDRFGVRPLFYAQRGGTLYFASEVKALFATGEVPAAPDPVGLDEIFTFWGARAPRTAFAGVRQLEPGTLAVWQDGRLRVSRYYELDYPEAREESRDALDRLDAIMRSSVSLRMRADVPVGGYLSGGLDSSITCALASAQSPFALRTFSVTFEDPQLDESAFQQVVARQVRSDHAIAHIGPDDIARVFPDVVRHTETPIVRTAPAPMYLLAKLTRERGIKVVLTGEGADELFLGYDLFKETKIRHFCLRQPASAGRPKLFDRIYPYLSHGRGGEMWRRSFLDAGPTSDPLFSHLPRFQTTARAKAFYSAELRASLAGVDVAEELRQSLPARFDGWSPENRAAYLEMTTLLASYLLSSQGERMGMAHGVEGRFPFLDHRLFEYAAALPTRSKLQGLEEKAILKRWAEPVVPPAVRARHKQPYRAPDAPAFFGPKAPEYVQELLSEESIRRSGLFDPTAVSGLVRRARAGRITGFGENQAFVGILSAQLWHHTFFARAIPSQSFANVSATRGEVTPAAAGAAS